MYVQMLDIYRKYGEKIWFFYIFDIFENITIFFNRTDNLSFVGKPVNGSASGMISCYVISCYAHFVNFLAW